MFVGMNCSDCTKPQRSAQRNIAATGQYGLNSADIASMQVDSKPDPDQRVAKSEPAQQRWRRRAHDQRAIEPASVIVPLRAAVMPKPSCSIIGSRNGTAPTAMRRQRPAQDGDANVGIRMRRKSRIGWSCCRHGASTPSEAKMPMAISAAVNARIPRRGCPVPAEQSASTTRCLTG